MATENHHCYPCLLGETSSFMVVFSIVILVFRGVDGIGL